MSKILEQSVHGLAGSFVYGASSGIVYGLALWLLQAEQGPILQ